MKSAIRLNRRCTEKKERNKAGWLKMEDSPEYQDGLKRRYKVERKFGEAKKWHGYGQCCYIGFRRHSIQRYLAFMALNLKRLGKLLTGVNFTGEGKVHIMSG